MVITTIFVKNIQIVLYLYVICGTRMDFEMEFVNFIRE